MTKVMPQNQIEEKLRWIKPLIEGESSISEISKFCPFSRKTIYNSGYMLTKHKEN